MPLKLFTFDLISRLSVLNRFYSIVTELVTAQEATYIVKKQAENQQKEYIKMLDKDNTTQSMIENLRHELDEKDKSKKKSKAQIATLVLIVFLS